MTRTRAARSFGIAAIALVIAGSRCGGGGGGGNIVGLGGGGGVTERVYTVTYTANATGDGVIDQVRYRDSEGLEQRVSTPGSPFSRSLTMEPGDEVAIAVFGTVTNGALSAGLSTTSSDGEGTILDEEDSCDSPGLQIDCNLGTAVFTLQ